MAIKVKIGDETHEVTANDIELEENQLIIDKNNPPEGFFTKKAVNALIQDRLDKRGENVKKELLDDNEYHKQILSKYNISLDDDGNPKGLKPDFDPQEWIQNKSKEIRKPLEDELENFKSRYEKTRNNRIKDSILAATKGKFQEQYTKKPDDGVDPIVVSQYDRFFTEDENTGEIIKIDKDGNVEIDHATGTPITADRYFSNQEKFGEWMVDRRQRGTGFQNGDSGGKRAFSRDDISNMNSSDFEKNVGEMLKAANEGRLQ